MSKVAIEACSSGRASGSVWQDVERNLLGRPDSVGARVRLLLTARYRSVFVFRVAQWLGGHRMAMIADLLKQMNQSSTGADLSWEATVGPGLILFHPVGVVVGPDCVVGRDATLQQGVTIGGLGALDGPRSSPLVGDRVTFGTGAKVIGAIQVGDRVTVGANAVVVKSVPPGVTAMGVPARWDRG